MKYDVEKWKRMDIQLNGSEVADHPCSQCGFHFHLCVHTMQNHVTQTALSTNSNVFLRNWNCESKEPGINVTSNEVESRTFPAVYIQSLP